MNVSDSKDLAREEKVRARLIRQGFVSDDDTLTDSGRKQLATDNTVFVDIYNNALEAAKVRIHNFRVGHTSALSREARDAMNALTERRNGLLVLSPYYHKVEVKGVGAQTSKTR